MEDCIVGKKYRLDELLNGDLWENNNLEGDIYEFVGADALSCTFIDDEKKEYTFCKVDGYPKMELVEEVQNDLPLGLSPSDRLLLKTLVEKFNGGPVGVKTLSAATGEEEDTIEEVIEPYLIQTGLLEKTPRGRCATEKAYDHLGVAYMKD